MTYSRYLGRETFINNDPNYRKAFFDQKGIRQLEQFETAELGYPSLRQMEGLNNLSLVWTSASRLYNLAEEFYGDSTYWWVIAWYNKKPTEAHFEIGDVIYIPTPLERVLELF
jgi:nucleoid-associated protein YgaU